MAIEFVSVRNPANDMVSRISKKAFEDTFEAKGFELVDEEAEREESLNTSGHPAAGSQEQAEDRDEGQAEGEQG